MPDVSEVRSDWSGYTWEPESDITVFELARCMPALVYGRTGGRDIVEQLPSECKRHFKWYDDVRVRLEKK